MNITGLKNNIHVTVSILKALSNEKRLLILCALVETEKSVSTLEAEIGLSQSALSQHLARLRRDRLVVTRREAQTIYYAITPGKVEAILACLCALAEDPGP